MKECEESEGGGKLWTNHGRASTPSKLNRRLVHSRMAQRLQNGPRPVAACSTPLGNPALTLDPMHRLHVLQRCATVACHPHSLSAQSHANTPIPHGRKSVNRSLKYSGALLPAQSFTQPDSTAQARGGVLSTGMPFSPSPPHGKQT